MQDRTRGSYYHMVLRPSQKNVLVLQHLYRSWLLSAPLPESTVFLKDTDWTYGDSFIYTMSNYCVYFSPFDEHFSICNNKLFLGNYLMKGTVSEKTAFQGNNLLISHTENSFGKFSSQLSLCTWRETVQLKLQSRYFHST